MNNRQYIHPYLFRLVILVAIAAAVVIAGPVTGSARQSGSQSVEAGYSALRLFLKDEQRLTTIRRIKTVLTFDGVSSKRRN